MGGADGEAGVYQLLQFRVAELCFLMFVRKTVEVFLVQLIGQSLKIGMVADGCQMRRFPASCALSHGAQSLPQAFW